jgi:hypothetical protein
MTDQPKKNDRYRDTVFLPQSIQEHVEWVWRVGNVKAKLGQPCMHVIAASVMIMGAAQKAVKFTIARGNQRLMAGGDGEKLGHLLRLRQFEY